MHQLICSVLDYCDSRVNEGQAILQSLRFRVASSSIREADPAIPELRSSYQLPSGPRPQPHIVTSTVSCPAKLLKLKGELLNILFVFPEKVLRWPDQDPSVEAEINAAGETAALQVYSSAAKYTSSGQVPPSSIDLSPENIDRLADKAARKAKRRLRRKISIDNFVKSVQRASCAQQLLPLVSLLEQVVPNQLLFKSHFLWNEYCADSIISIAEVATRIYLLDRRIMFNELSGVENASLACPFRLRTQFIPRCAVNNCCTRGLGHQGKCSYGPNTFSRFPDHFQLAPPQDPFSQQHATPLPSQSRATIMPTQPSRAISRPREEDPLQTLSTFLERAHIDIEQMQPYVPTYSEVAVSEWL